MIKKGFLIMVIMYSLLWFVFFGLYSEGLIIGSIFAFQIWGSFDTEGLIHGGAYFRNFTVWH